jgi:hypothetical protein
MAIDIEGNGHIDLVVDFNDGYRYTNTITAKDTVVSFPEYEESQRPVVFTFVPEGVGLIDSIVIDNTNQGPINTFPYHVKNTEDGKIEAYFNP